MSFVKNRAGLEDLCKRRFFYRQGSDIYGGVAGFYTYGPPGCAVKNNLVQLWRRHFVQEENMMEIEDTCIMPHQVLAASGHVERFNDFMVKDVKDESKFYRADKLLEEVMEQKMADKACTEEQRVEYQTVFNKADGYSMQEMSDLFKHYNIKSPETGNDLSELYEFNLMFPTPIGPSGTTQGYLRPETAQGIFLNYKFCLEQNQNRVPMGVAQVGKVFRNEIAPRAGLTRVREFSQAEVEWFVNPKEKDHPRFKEVADLEINLFASDNQLAAGQPALTRLGDAVKSGMINNETLGYFIGRTYLFLIEVGLKKEFIRFRQHLPTEMAHYACDCWDAEAATCYGWLEIVGIADRSCYDLNAHARAAKVDLNVQQKLDEPVEMDVFQLTKTALVNVQKHFRKDGKLVKEFLAELSEEKLKCHVEEASEKGSTDVTIDGRVFTLEPAHLACETKRVTQHTLSFTPGVIEPSFGIDRIIFSIFEQSYYVRPEEEGDSKQGAPARAVLQLSTAIAPYKVVVLPLDQRIARDEKFATMLSSVRKGFSQNAITFTIDESGATVGRRYARNDELGIPFAMTVDFQSLEDGTVTLRERDSTKQVRLALSDIPSLVSDLLASKTTWESALEKHAAL